MLKRFKNLTPEQRFEEWKKKYYPIPANSPKIKTQLQAAKHSLRKWKGLKKSVLDKYGLRYTDFGIFVLEDFLLLSDVDGSTCALCSININESKHVDCSKCPLAIVRKGIPCDEPMDNYKEPYDPDDPTEMIHWLEKAVKYCKKKNI